MLRLHPGGQMRIAEQPAARHLAVLIKAGIGVCMPRIIPLIALLAEIYIIGEVGIGAAIGMQAVVALPRLEPAFSGAGPLDRLAAEAEAFHPLLIRRHMGLADQPGGHAEIAHMIAEGLFPDAERDAVIGRAMGLHIAPRIERHARRAADRRLTIGMGKDGAVIGERVDMRGVDRRMTGAAEIVRAQLVTHDEKDIPDLTHD